MATPPTPKARSGPSVLVVVLIVAAIVVPVIGLLAAIAMPAFVKYTRRAKAAEANLVLANLARAEETYFAEHRAYVALPRRPASPSCEPIRQPLPPDPLWDQLGVSLEPPIRGAYEVAVAPDGQSFTATGLLDLDCDGVPSMRVRTSASGEVQISGDPE